MDRGDWGTEWREMALAGPPEAAWAARGDCGAKRGDGATRVTVTGFGEVKVC